VTETNFTLKKLAEALGAELRGNPECVITGISPIQNAKKGDICFLNNPYYKQYLATTQASAVVLSAQDADQCPLPVLVLKNPYLGFARLAHFFSRVPHFEPGIDASSQVAKSAQIDPTAYVGPYCKIGERSLIGAGSVIQAGTVLGDDVVLGENCCLYPQVTLYSRVKMGDRVILHSGVVIGSDGFGLAQNEKHEWVKIPQLGGVNVGHDVEIGANSCIDRGALEDTLIEDGVKIDNLVQVAHNVRIGAHTAIAGCVAIAGSANIGRYCMIGGGAGINGHITIADQTVITAMAGVMSSIEKPGYYTGGPAQPHRRWKRVIAYFMQLDELAKRIKKLEKLNQ